jgi:hypothetical protein
VEGIRSEALTDAKRSLEVGIIHPMFEVDSEHTATLDQSHIPYIQHIPTIRHIPFSEIQLQL